VGAGGSKFDDRNVGWAVVFDSADLLFLDSNASLDETSCDRVRFVWRRNAGLSREDCALQLLATAMPGGCSKGKLAGLLRGWDDVEEQWGNICSGLWMRID
jgi:hypothetical protein